jgi:autotransporter passenger strand-loop-strand repeat protein
MSAPVTVTGSPGLTLNDGAAATYDINASNPSQGVLVFDYTIGANDFTPDLEITGVNLPTGATVVDANGHDADLTGAVNTPTNLQIGATFVTAVVPSQTAEADAGATVQLTLQTSRPVTVDTSGGAPTLTLNDGATATYDATLSVPQSNNLTFDYTVGSNDRSSDLEVTKVNTNGAAIVDALGQPVDFATALNVPTGLQIGPSALTVLSVEPSQTVAGVGETGELTLAMSEPAIVTGGTPLLDLSNGATAVYDAAASKPSAGLLVFDYAVGAADQTADLAISAVSLDGASVQDLQGYNADFSGAVAATTGLQITPLGVRFVSAPAVGTVDFGQSVQLSLTMTEGVTVAGAPTLTLSDGAIATYEATASNPSTGTMVFDYTIGSNDHSPNLQVASVNLPTGATVQDADGYSADFSGAINQAFGLAVGPSLLTVTSIAASPGSGKAVAGQVVELALTMNEAVAVDTSGGSPTLLLNNGDTAAYDAAASAPLLGKLVFDYTTTGAAATPDLEVVDVDLSGATIVDSGGYTADFSGALNKPTGLGIVPAQLYAGPGTTLSGVAISSGVTDDVLSGGAASAMVINSGGTQIVYGAESGTIVNSGGLDCVAAGGSASGIQIGSGGVEGVYGTMSGAVVDSGGALTVLDGGTLEGNVVNDGALIFDLTNGGSFSGALAGDGLLSVEGGGALDVTSACTGAAQVDDDSTLEFASTYVGVATFSGSSTGPGGTLEFDSDSTGPITVVNPNDTVIAQPGSDNWINAIVSYTLPSNVDALFLYAGAQGTGNSDASGDALYALDANHTQTLTGNSPNDTFVVYNSSDVVVPQGGSHDVVYAAASYTLPTGVDTLILEGSATKGTGNSDAAGDGLYAANPGQVATLTGNSANDTFVVYNSADVVVPMAGSHDVVYAAVSYTLPTGVDVLILEAGTQAVGNSDAAGDALYAADAGIAQTLIGNSANDTFVVYNSADVVVPKAGSRDLVYSAVNYTLPTGVDSLILEAGTQAVGNSDTAGDTLYAANAGIAQTLTGNSHNDTFAVYNSADVVIGQAGSTDTVYAAVNFTLPTNVDTLFLEGSGATHGTGNNDAVDTLFGNAGVASTLVAGSGADTLFVTGSAGTVLTGGTGHDTFAFPNSMGHDEVTNFGIAKDTLQFNAALFANFTAAMNAASQSGANTVFTIDANDTVTLDNVTKSSLAASNFHFT